MNLLPVYSYESYKQWLRHLITSQKTVRAFQRQLAEAAGCQPSYLSQVLNGKNHLLPEQLYRLAVFAGFSPEDCRFALLLLERERSGNVEHQKFLTQHVRKIRHHKTKLSQTLELPDQDAALERATTVYYSQWYYSAIHILCTLPEGRSIAEISTALALKKPVTQRAVTRLEKMGLITKHSPHHWKATEHSLLIKSDHPLFKQHHANWRFHAASQLDPEAPNSIHYTGVYSLSREDLAQIYGELQQTIQKVLARVRPSREEVVVNFNLDWYLVADDQ